MKILSINAWLLPFNISKENNLRFSAILELVSSQNYDVILFQEIWLSKYIKTLEKKFPNKYNIYSNKGLFLNGSGLVTLISKDITVKNYAHKTFQNINPYNIEELIAGKGYCVLDIEVFDENIKLINLHVYAPKSLSQKAYAQKQLTEIVEDLNHKDIILGGDFNLEYKEILQVIDIFEVPANNKNTISKENKYQSLGFNKKSKNEFRIDHILISKTSNLTIKKEEVLILDVSDHYPVSAVICAK